MTLGASEEQSRKEAQNMAVYRCPSCGEIVRKEAKRCRTCGLWFDLEHEPVLDEGKGTP